MLVKEDGDIIVVSGTLTGAYCGSGEAQLIDSISCSHAVHEVVSAGAVRSGNRDDSAEGAVEGVETWHVEKFGERAGDSVSPEAVVIYEREKASGLGWESVVARVWRSGVVLTLERVSKDDDKSKRWIGEDGEVKIATGHLVYLVNDEHLRMLEKRRFPSVEAE